MPEHLQEPNDNLFVLTRIINCTSTNHRRPAITSSHFQDKHCNLSNTANFIIIKISSVVYKRDYKLILIPDCNTTWQNDDFLQSATVSDAGIEGFIQFVVYFSKHLTGSGFNSVSPSVTHRGCLEWNGKGNWIYHNVKYGGTIRISHSRIVL